MPVVTAMGFCYNLCMKQNALSESSTSRRGFIAGLGAAGAMPWLGGCVTSGFAVRRPAPGAPIRLAFVGCGSRAVQLVTMTAGERIVAMCDPDSERFGIIADRLKALKRGNEVAGIRTFGDWPEMFDAMGDEIDAVIVATPNHQHVRPTIEAMRRGIHVYLEKPMALTVEEVRLLEAAARRWPVATQVGSHGHSNEGTRMLVDYVRSGALGQVRDVWFWDCRVNAFETLPPEIPVPSTFNWTAWQGPAEERPYRKDIHTHEWHNWRIYGNGSVGNTGTHFFDPVFWALDLGGVAPRSVELVECRPGGPGSWNVRNTVEWEFPARKGKCPVRLHWYDGLVDGVPMDAEHLGHWNNCSNRKWQNMPPQVLELEARYKMDLGREGFIVVGERGVIRMGSSGGGFMFVPSSLKKKLTKPPQLVPREKGFTHMNDFFRAVRGEREAGCNFAYSVPIAVSVLLANVAIRSGVRHKLLWNGTRVTNDASANRFLSATYRKGFSLPVV